MTRAFPALVLLAAMIGCAPPLALEAPDGGTDGHPCLSAATCGGLACFFAKGECPGSCVARPRAGEACGVETPSCPSGFACIQGSCRAPEPVGEACAPGLSECAPPAFCDGDSDLCVGPRGAGGRCGYLPVDGPHDLNSCEVGLKCTVATGDADGVCVVPAELGELCGPTKPCRLGWCDGVCRALLPAGTACTSDEACQTACVNGVCARPCG